MSHMNWSPPRARHCWRSSPKVSVRCKIWLPEKPVLAWGRERTKRGPMFCAPCSARRPQSKTQNPGLKQPVPKRDWETDTIAVLETNLDDTNPEILGHFVETALTAGALDVFYTPVQMKKNRPGVLLTVLCAESEADRFSEMILCETSAFGVRRTVAERRKLRREFVDVKTTYGRITVKLGKFNEKVVQAAPEFESCKKLAARAKIPLKRVYDAANRAIRTKE